MPADEFVDDYDSSIDEVKLINYSGNEKRLALRKNNVEITIDDFGEGHKFGLLLTSLVRSRKNTVILIEEIESHHHPSSLKKIIDNLVPLANDNSNQLIITTHSPDVLEYFSKHNHVKFFHLLKNNDLIYANEILSDDYTMWKDIGWDVNNYLRKEKIIVVEGEIDQIIFRHCFKKLFGYWPEESGINIIYSSGKGKSQKELLKALAYEGKKIFYQTDLDDKLDHEVKDIVLNYFKELRAQGEIKEDEEKIIFKHKLGTKKVFMKNNILLTGDVSIKNIQKHAIEDHIISILIKNLNIVEKLNGNKEKLEISAEKGKQVLGSVFTDYSSNKLVDIMNEITPENMDENLKRIVTAFNN